MTIDEMLAIMTFTLTIVNVLSNILLHLQIKSPCCSSTPVGINTTSDKNSGNNIEV